MNLNGHELAGIFHDKFKNPIYFPAFLDEAAVDLIGNAFSVQTAAVFILNQKFIDDGRLQLYVLGEVIDFPLALFFFKFIVCFIEIGFLVEHRNDLIQELADQIGFQTQIFIVCLVE